MKKITLLYIAIVNLISVIIYSIDLFLNQFHLEDILMLIFSLLNLIFLYNIYESKYLKISFSYLSFAYLLQSFSILTSGFTWKLITGTDITLYIFKEVNILTKIDFKVFNLYSICNSLNGTNWGIGINFIHLFIFFNLLGSLRKIITTKSFSLT